MQPHSCYYYFSPFLFDFLTFFFLSFFLLLSPYCFLIIIFPLSFHYLSIVFPLSSSYFSLIFHYLFPLSSPYFSFLFLLLIFNLIFSHYFLLYWPITISKPNFYDKIIFFRTYERYISEKVLFNGSGRMK